ncbi:MAG: rod-binding protein [Sphingomonas sp.]
MTISTPSTGLRAGTLDAANVSTDTSRLSTRANLDKAGTQFEAVFTQIMLKSLRSGHLAKDIFDSQALDTFRDFQDQNTAQILAGKAPLGIGKAVVEFLSRSQPALQAPPPGVAEAAGGTGAKGDTGQSDSGHSDTGRAGA